MIDWENGQDESWGFDIMKGHARGCPMLKVASDRAESTILPFYQGIPPSPHSNDKPHQMRAPWGNVSIVPQDSPYLEVFVSCQAVAFIESGCCNST
jgi:hypothetical protein